MTKEDRIETLINCTNARVRGVEKWVIWQDYCERYGVDEHKDLYSDNHSRACSDWLAAADVTEKMEADSRYDEAFHLVSVPQGRSLTERAISRVMRKMGEAIIKIQSEQ